MKRSLYLDDSTHLEVQELADRHDRTWSGQVLWLLRLSMAATHLLPDAPDGKLDDESTRRYIYPPKGLAADLDDLLRRANRRKRRSRWSFSALARALLRIGIPIEQEIARTIEEVVARLGALRAVVTTATARDLAIVLVSRYDTAALVEMRAAPVDPSMLKRWGVDEDTYNDAVGVALEARGHIDTLEEPPHAARRQHAPGPDPDPDLPTPGR